MPRRTPMEIARSNMRDRGFKFNTDGVPIVCAPPLDGRPLPPGETFGMTLGEWEYAYRHDRTLFIQYPSSDLIGDFRYTITYALDLKGFPVMREDGLTFDEVINQHWLANAYRGTRPDSLRAVTPEQRAHFIIWWKHGEKVHLQQIGEIVDMMLDPDRVQAQKDYFRAKLDAMRAEVQTPLRPKEESDPAPSIAGTARAGNAFGESEWSVRPSAPADTPSRDQESEPVSVLEVEIPASQMVRAAPGVMLEVQEDGSILAKVEEPYSDRPRVVWLPQKQNGWQHPDPEETVYPLHIERLSLRHHSKGATLRGWGNNLGHEIINGTEVDFVFVERHNRYEANLTPGNSKRITS